MSKIIIEKQLLDETIGVLHVAEDVIDSLLDGISCDAGNPDGGSKSSCEHCSLLELNYQIKTVVDRLTGLSV